MHTETIIDLHTRSELKAEFEVITHDPKGYQLSEPVLHVSFNDSHKFPVVEIENLIRSGKIKSTTKGE